MSAACAMGALVGVEAYRAPLRRFGHNLGMAFQIADDILDYTGSEEVTGKPTGHDLRERKVTLPLVGALRAAGPAEEAVIREFFAKVNPPEEAIARIVALVADLGGVEYAHARALEYAARAEEALEGLPEGPSLDALRGAIAYAVDRNR